MPVAYAALLLVVLVSGCARAKPDTPAVKPTGVTTQPVTPAAAPPATRRPPPAGAPAPGARAPAPPVAGKAAASAEKTPASTQALDLDELIARLKETKAIGIFTKITLRNQVDDLLDQFSEHYQGKVKRTMTDLRRSYDLLMMKVLSLLQDGDQMLATAIVSSRESIWRLLADPKTFATLRG